MTLPNKPPYRSILLRMWIEPSSYRPSVWRFSVEDVETSKRCGFADLDHLISHLLVLMEEPMIQPALEAKEQIEPS